MSLSKPTPTTISHKQPKIASSSHSTKSQAAAPTTSQSSQAHSKIAAKVTAKRHGVFLNPTEMKKIEEAFKQMFNDRRINTSHSRSKARDSKYHHNGANFSLLPEVPPPVTESIAETTARANSTMSNLDSFLDVGRETLKGIASGMTLSKDDNLLTSALQGLTSASRSVQETSSLFTKLAIALGATITLYVMTKGSPSNAQKIGLIGFIAVLSFKEKIHATLS